MTKIKKTKRTFEPQEIRAIERAEAAKKAEENAPPAAPPVKLEAVEQVALTIGVGDGSVEVEDLSSVEVGKYGDSIERRFGVGDDGRVEVLVFPRMMLWEKFQDRSGILSLPKVVNSDWFKRILKRYGFTSDTRFVKDSKGRYLLKDAENDSYTVSQRI